MELKEVIRKRHSVRHFSKKIPPKEIINEIIDYANLAPSAGNLQARDFIIIDDQILKDQLSEAALNQEFIAEAPITIVVCANLKRISSYGARGRELYCIQDASAAIEHILLLAVDNGLDACWVGAFDEQAVTTILKLPLFIRPVAMIPLGYSQRKSTGTTRRDSKELIHYNQW